MRLQILCLLLMAMCLHLQSSYAQYIEPEKREKIQKDSVQKPAVQKDFDKDDENPSFASRLRFGGNFSISFGNITLIDLSPAIGYAVSERFVPGVGLTYMYFRRRFNNNFDFETNIYGGRVFSQYLLTENFFLWGELESLSVSFYNPATDQTAREWVSSPLVGGGYRSPTGGRGAFNITVLYNLAYDSLRSPYASPLVVRIGFF
jgi:hypothetical protein